MITFHLKKMLAGRSLPSLMARTSVDWKKMMFGLLLCTAGNAFGMQRAPVRLVRPNAEHHVDQILAKDAVRSFVSALDELSCVSRRISGIKSYGAHNEKELDALAHDFKLLQSVAEIMHVRLERIKQKKD